MRKNKKIIYANVYRNTINDGDSQTSPLPMFPQGGGGGDVCTQGRLPPLDGFQFIFSLRDSENDLFSLYLLVL